MQLKLILRFIFIFFVFNKSHGEDLCSHTENSFRCVKYLSNYDADTIKFHIPKTHPLFGDKINIRVKGVDTPEIRTNDECEKYHARTAKRLVENLLKNAKRIDLNNIQRGKYFRVVADINLDGKSLKEYLLKNNLAYEYDGGQKNKINWCKKIKSRSTASENRKKGNL